MQLLCHDFLTQLLIGRKSHNLTEKMSYYKIDQVVVRTVVVPSSFFKTVIPFTVSIWQLCRRVPLVTLSFHGMKQYTNRWRHKSMTSSSSGSPIITFTIDTFVRRKPSINIYHHTPPPCVRPTPLLFPLLLFR